MIGMGDAFDASPRRSAVNPSGTDIGATARSMLATEMPTAAET